jgi:serine/threonine-protein kinase HipA
VSAFELEVLMAGHRAGRVASASGKLRLRYHDRYRGAINPTPLSMNLPVQIAEHGHDAVAAFLWGLLPDNDRVLRRWARTYQASVANPASLLSSPVGIDCAGAVQFVPVRDVDEVLVAEGHVDWLTETEIAERLRDLARDSTDWLGERIKAGHFSLAGAQSKTALRYDPASGRWGTPHGPEPTTHIIKPGVAGFADLALNEHLCLAAARKIGLRAARSWVVRFEDQVAVAVARFDRHVTDGAVRRIHQEDLCQALGVHPESKYQHDGGPSPEDIATLFDRVMPATTADDARSRFLDALVFNWLIGATDGHAKNYGLLLSGSQVRFAPLYDIASMLPYEHDAKQLKLAMKIGGEYRFKAIGPRNWEKLTNALAIMPEALLERARDLAMQLPDAIADAAATDDVRALPSDLPARLIDRVADHAGRCRVSIERHLAQPAPHGSP